MKVVKKNVSELTSREFNKMAGLNMRKNGSMEGEIRYQRYASTRPQYKDTRDTYAIWEGDMLIAWALGVAGEGSAFYFYVRSSERRKGYGTALMQAIKKDCKTPFVYPHDARSGAFFSEFKVRSNPQWRRRFMAKKPRRF